MTSGQPSSAPSIHRDSNGRGYWLTAAVELPADLQEVFAFFSDAFRLQDLTPEFVHFQVLTPGPIQIRAGTQIDYRIRLHRIPVSWRSEITVWDPPRQFVDEQLKGPYSFWRHEHLFEATPRGTQVTDRVHYGVPGGRLVHELLVKRNLLKIFAFRTARLQSLFCSNQGTAFGRP
jgi:ligand-binding SRPBCC domain-containing protein